VFYNPIDEAIHRLVATFVREQALNPEEKRLLHQLLVPFKLLAMRSAQKVSHTARVSSMSLLPKDMCRMVGDMLGPYIKASDSEEEE
jgi:hypothetical protein